MSSPKLYISEKDWLFVKNRANSCCEYCKYIKAYCGSPFSLDHIIPLALNGAHDAENWAFACFGCNQSKFTATTAHDPVTDQVVPLFHPRNDHWSEHFKWSDDLLYMEGITPVGRATVIRLKTNRPALVNLRKVLIGRGHPPA